MNVREALTRRARINRELNAAVLLAQKALELNGLEDEERQRLVRVCERGNPLTHDYAVLCDAIARANEETSIEIELELP